MRVQVVDAAKFLLIDWQLVSVLRSAIIVCKTVTKMGASSCKFQRVFPCRFAQIQTNPKMNRLAYAMGK
jgi:hypothetical protein